MSTPTVSYTYDNNGNTKTKSDGTQYTWDYDNQLTKIVLPGAPFNRALCVQSHDMLYKTSRDILYTPALARPARRKQGCRG